METETVKHLMQLLSLSFALSLSHSLTIALCLCVTILPTNNQLIDYISLYTEFLNPYRIRLTIECMTVVHSKCNQSEMKKNTPKNNIFRYFFSQFCVLISNEKKLKTPI